MKKYRFLEQGDVFAPGDERKTESGFIPIEGDIINLIADNYHERYELFRRPVPYTGRVAFLVNYSPMIRVEIDTTGLDGEQIDDALAEAAKAKHCYEHQQYMNDFHDNIDWGQTEEDTECPYVEDEPKNPGKYRYLEAGERTEIGDEFNTEGNIWTPIITPGSIVEEITSANKWLRRPITEPQYRPFREGDMLEQGDQFRFSENDEWKDLTDPSGPIDQSTICSRDFRKLIK